MPSLERVQLPKLQVERQHRGHNKAMADQEEAIPDREGCWCKTCHRELDPAQPRPCPYCGALNRIYHNIVREAAVASVGTEMRQMRAGFKRPLVEMIGSRRRTDRYGRRKGIIENRVIDRVNDKYEHVLKDAETGEIFHEEHLRLSEHKNLPGVSGERVLKGARPPLNRNFPLPPFKGKGTKGIGLLWSRLLAPMPKAR